MSATLYCGDVRDVLARLPEQSVQCVVTSPPYWGLRDYGVPGQIGLERTPREYVAAIVEVFGLAGRAMRDDGTLWLNLGDSYYSGDKGGYERPTTGKQATSRGTVKGLTMNRLAQDGLKPKDLVGIPWRVAFALQEAGWYLRSDIIWHKTACMPESVTDRPTKSHEYVFLLAKAERYYYDAAAIREPDAGTDHPRAVLNQPEPSGGLLPAHKGIRKAEGRNGDGRNARTVWTLGPQPYDGAHFATFPEELARRCILAGSKPGDTVLDPFGGSGTTASVATGHARQAIHIDLNPAYIELARQRIGPLVCEVAA